VLSTFTSSVTTPTAAPPLALTVCYFRKAQI
jgi:hypothetical protein